MIRWPTRVWRAVRALLLPARAERDLDDELRFHQEMDAADWQRRGLDPAGAAFASRRSFGSPARLKEQIRDLRLTSPLEYLLRDLRGGVRSLRRAPGFSTAVIVTLGLGIGAVATMYSIVRGVLRDLPVPEPHRLVHVEGIDRRGQADRGSLRGWEIAALAVSQRSLEALAAYRVESFHVGDPDRHAERWSGTRITLSGLAALQVAPARGRTFAPEDAVPGAAPVVLLGHALWEGRYGRDPSIIGKAIRLNGTPHTVVGIMPEEFRFPVEQDLWVPVDPAAGAMPGMGPGYVAFGRLRDDASADGARAEFLTLATRLAALAPVENADRTVRARPYRDRMIPASARMVFRAMMLVVSFVLLVACANAANLLLTRSLARRHELAVRTALGAARHRIVIQLLTEVLVLAGVAGGLGLLLAQAGVEFFNRMLAHELAFWMKVRVDLGVVVFAAAAVLLSAVAAGLAPARQSLQVNVGDVLRERTRGSWRMGWSRRWLVGGQVALAGSLLVLTALMATGVLKDLQRFEGIEADGVLTGALALRPEAHPDTAQVQRLLSDLQDRLSALPGVHQVGLTDALPGFTPARARVAVDGAPESADQVETRVVSVAPGFFPALSIGVIEGRDLTWADGVASARVVLVNQRFVERHLGPGSALGRRVRLGEAGQAWMTVVGVVPDVGRPRPGEGDVVYQPLGYAGGWQVSLMLRTDGDPVSLAPALREAVRQLDAEAALSGVNRLDRVISLATSSERFFGLLFSLFGAAALIMAGIGLFGLVAFAVRQQTRELGIRVALGARAMDLVGPVSRAALWQLGGGLLVGLGLAAVLAPPLGDALMGSDPHDAGLYAIVGVVLAAAGLAATWIPARRALRLAPADVLREE